MTENLTPLQKYIRGLPCLMQILLFLAICIGGAVMIIGSSLVLSWLWNGSMTYLGLSEINPTTAYFLIVLIPIVYSIGKSRRPA